MVEFLSLHFFFAILVLIYQECLSPLQYKHIEVFNLLLLQPELGIKKHTIFICFIVQCD